jgi:hypothetical protein
MLGEKLTDSILYIYIYIYNMKTVALTKDEVHSKSTYQEYLKNTNELTVLVEPVNDTFTILGIFKYHISPKCHELLHYYELVSKKPLIIPSCTFLHTILDNISSVHIYQTSTGVTKWRGINLSAYDNGVLDAQYPGNGLCTDGTIAQDGTAIPDGDTGGWFYTTDADSSGAPSRVAHVSATSFDDTHLAYEGTPLAEVVESVDHRWSSSYPTPSQIDAAMKAGVNLFRVPFMPQFMPEIATGWAKEGFDTGGLAGVYKPGNCLYFSFYMSTVDYILKKARRSHQNLDVKVIIDCHSYMRWAPMSILATSTALDGPPSRNYSMDLNTDLTCPYALSSARAPAADTSNNEYRSLQDILGPPSGWSSSDTKKTTKITWTDISGNPNPDKVHKLITIDNITTTLCSRATDLPKVDTIQDIHRTSNWDNFDNVKPFCSSNNAEKNACYGNPTKTVLGINCFPLLWYNLLYTKFYPCNDTTCIPPSTPAPGPQGCVQVGGTCEWIGGIEQKCCNGLKKAWPEGICTCTPKPGVDMCTQISKDVVTYGTTLLKFIKDNSDNIWLDLMNEPNQLNTRDLGTSYGKVIKVLRQLGVTNKLLIEGNYWSGMHAQVFPGDSKAEGWQWPTEQPPRYKNGADPVKTHLDAYIMTDSSNNRANYLHAIRNSPIEILYTSILKELKTGPNPTNIGRWALNLHQYMDHNSSGLYGCYDALEKKINDIDAMKLFTRFNAIEMWSKARAVPLCITEFGAQLYTDQSYLDEKGLKCAFYAKVGPTMIHEEKKDDNWRSKVCSAMCEHKLNLFLEMIDTSPQVLGWTIWRATPPVSWAQHNTMQSIIGNEGAAVFGWSNGITWETDIIDTYLQDYQFLKNSAHFSQPFTATLNDMAGDIRMPFIATGNLWALKGGESNTKFWDDFHKQKYPIPVPSQIAPKEPD